MYNDILYYCETSIIKTPFGPLTASPVYGGVLILEVLYAIVHVHVRDVMGQSSGACPVEGGGCISEVSFSYALHDSRF